jgi:ribosomal protein S18 acetylase RimI-like enzyme
VTAPRIYRLTASHVPSLARLLRAISDAGDDVWFHPHSFSIEALDDLARSPGFDLYFVAIDGEAAVAYGLLRGWNEGYTIPSAGVAVGPTDRGRGLGRMMMDHLHAQARARGAQSVRLRVAPGNQQAMRLYTQLGYVFTAEDRGELVGTFRLTGPEGRDGG